MYVWLVGLQVMLFIQLLFIKWILVSKLPARNLRTRVIMQPHASSKKMAKLMPLFLV
jgi:hypothetical protein